MELSEILPYNSKFYLSALDQDIYLSPPTLGFQVEFEKKYNAKIESYVEQGTDLDKLIVAAFNLMTPASKRTFKIREVIEVDDLGNESVKKIGGVELFKKSIVANEFIYIYQAIIEACKFPPVVIEGLKKKIQEMEKINGN